MPVVRPSQRPSTGRRHRTRLRCLRHGDGRVPAQGSGRCRWRGTSTRSRKDGARRIASGRRQPKQPRQHERYPPRRPPCPGGVHGARSPVKAPRPPVQGPPPLAALGSWLERQTSALPSSPRHGACLIAPSLGVPWAVYRRWRLGGTRINVIAAEQMLAQHIDNLSREPRNCGHSARVHAHTGMSLRELARGRATRRERG